MKKMDPAFSQSVALRAESPKKISPVQYASGPQCFIFDDGRDIHGYTTVYDEHWRIETQHELSGWTINGPDLYVQDGPVTCQFDINGLRADKKSLPYNVLALDANAGAKFSAPVVWLGDSGGPCVYVLESSQSGARIVPLAANLTRRDDIGMFHGTFLPDAMELFLLVTANHSSLQYLSQGRIVVVSISDQLENRYDPSGSGPHWLTVNRANRLGCALLEEGNARSVWARFSPLPAPQDESQLYAVATPSQSTLVLAMPDGVCLDCRFDGRLCSPPALRKDPDSTVFAYAVVRDGSGDIQFGKYKLLPAEAPSAASASPLLKSERAAIAPWLAGYGVSSAVPLIPDALRVYLGAALQVCEIQDPVVAQSLGAAGLAAVKNIIAVADGSDAAEAAGAALRRLCAIPPQPMFEAYTALNHDATQTINFMKPIYGPAPQMMVPLLAAKFSPEAVAKLKVYTVAEIVFRLHPEAVDWKWWMQRYPPEKDLDLDLKSLANIRPPYPMSAAGIAAASVIRAGGYSEEEVASVVLSELAVHGHRDAARLISIVHPSVAILKAGYPECPPERVSALILGLLKSRREVVLLTAPAAAATFLSVYILYNQLLYTDEMLELIRAGLPQGPPEVGPTIG